MTIVADCFLTGNAPTMCILPPMTPESIAEQARCDAALAVRDELLAGVPQRRAAVGPALPDCGRIRAAFAHRDDPRRGLAGQLRCGRLSCPKCRERLRARTLRHALAALLLDVGEDGLPCCDRQRDPWPVLPIRQGPLYLWRGPRQQWPAIQARLRRIDRCAGYLRADGEDGNTAVIMDVALAGAEELTPAAAARLAAARIHAAPPRKGAVRWGGRWTPARRGKEWERLELRLTPEQAGDLARDLGAKVRPVRGAGEDAALVRGRAWVFSGVDIGDDALRDFWAALAGGGVEALRGRLAERNAGRDARPNGCCCRPGDRRLTPEELEKLERYLGWRPPCRVCYPTPRGRVDMTLQEQSDPVESDRRRRGRRKKRRRNRDGHPHQCYPHTPRPRVEPAQRIDG
jgi:hypothetical protein